MYTVPKCKRQAGYCWKQDARWTLIGSDTHMFLSLLQREAVAQ